MIPESFECAGFKINIELVESIPDRYGYFCEATNTITIAKCIKAMDDTLFELSQDFIRNTLAHEIIHCWQFYYNNQYDEAQAQVFANFMCEFLRTYEA